MCINQRVSDLTQYSEQISLLLCNNVLHFYRPMEFRLKNKRRQVSESNIKIFVQDVT